MRFARPKPLQPVDRSTGRHASWMELFFDLVFVAVVAQLTHYLIHHYTLKDFGIAVLLFLPMHFIWTAAVGYWSRYDMDRPLGRVVTTAWMACVLVYAVGIKDGLHGDMRLVIIPFLVARILVWNQWLWVLGWQKKDKDRFEIAGDLIGYFEIGLWAASLWMPQPYQQMAWLVAMATQFIWAKFLIQKTQVFVKETHEDHAPERLGLFVIIAMGESIIAVVAGLGGTVWNADAIVSAAGGFILIVSMWWLYFDTIDRHVSGSGKIGSGMLLNDLHIIVLAGLITLAAGVGRAVTDHPDTATFAMISGGLAMFIVPTYVIGTIMVSTRLADDAVTYALLALLAAAILYGPATGTAWTIALVVLAVVAYTLWYRRMDRQRLHPAHHDGQGHQDGHDEAPTPP